MNSNKVCIMFVTALENNTWKHLLIGHLQDDITGYRTFVFNDYNNNHLVKTVEQFFSWLKEITVDSWKQETNNGCLC